jgi:plasmid replication initiation protein
MLKKLAVQAKASKYDAGAVDRPAGDRWISMTNALTRAGHGLTLAEKRLVACGVSKLDSRKVYGPGEVPTTRISATEYAEIFGVDTDTAYDQLQAGAKHLYNRSITFYEAAHRRKGRPLDATKVTMRWVGQIHYQKGEGWVELYWWPKLLPHLTGIKNQFTSIQLRQTSALRSAYSWKLLELLTRFESNGWAEYTIEDFATSMDATEKQKADFAKLRTKIIEPAVKELTVKDGWLIQWHPIKTGRKVSALRFDFKRDPQGKLDV